MTNQDKKKSLFNSNLPRVLVFVLAFALILAIILVSLNAILPGFLTVLENGDQAQIVQYIRGFGSVYGVLLAFLLQFIQILSVVFPGGPIQIAIGLVFGTFGGFFICLVGYVLANLLVFWSVRRLGNRLDQLFSGGGSNRLRFITEAAHPGFVVALSCLLPFLPNGLVPYIAARTKISTTRFILATFLGCMPTLFLLCAIGNTLLQGNYLKMGLLCGLLVVGVLLLYLIRNHLFALSEKVQTAWETRKQSRTIS